MPPPLPARFISVFWLIGSVIVFIWLYRRWRINQASAALFTQAIGEKAGLIPTYAQTLEAQAILAKQGRNVTFDQARSIYIKMGDHLSKEGKL